MQLAGAIASLREPLYLQHTQYRTVMSVHSALNDVEMRALCV
jgi:hypothetical protein